MVVSKKPEGFALRKSGAVSTSTVIAEIFLQKAFLAPHRS
jgi:hypothetical protein